MTQNLEWNHALDAFAYLLNRPSFSVTEICSVPCDLNASMPIPNRRKNEELEENVKTDCKYYSGEHSVVVQTAFYHRDIYEILGMNDIKTDCKYYSGEHLLFCAVNTKCQNCVDYCPTVEGDANVCELRHE